MDHNDERDFLEEQANERAAREEYALEEYLAQLSPEQYAEWLRAQGFAVPAEPPCTEQPPF